MTKEELASRTEAAYRQTHDALQTVVDNLNQGQRKKLARIDEVKSIFDRYRVEIDE